MNDTLNCDHEVGSSRNYHEIELRRGHWTRPWTLKNLVTEAAVGRAASRSAYKCRTHTL